MQWLAVSNWRVAVKVAVAPLVLIISMVIMWAGSYSGLSQIEQGINRIVGNTSQKERSVAEISLAALQVQNDLYKLLNLSATAKDTKILPPLISSLKSKSGALSSQIKAELDRFGDTSEGARKLTSAYNDYVKEADGVLDMVEMDPVTGLLFMSTAEKKFGELEDAI